MTVKIKVGSQVFAVAWTNSIRIEANYMHGDMNGSSTVPVMYQRDELSEIAFDLEGLAFLRALRVPETDEAKDLVREFFAANANFDHSDEDVEDFIEDFVIQDDTDDSWSRRATLVDVKVFLFDEHGAKFTMDVLVNGERLDD